MKTRKRHDTAYPITATLGAAGSPVDLTGATVKILVKSNGSLRINAACAVLNQTTNLGQVTYTFLTNDVAVSGTYQVEFEVTFGDGSIATFPNSKYEQLQIMDDLG